MYFYLHVIVNFKTYLSTSFSAECTCKKPGQFICDGCSCIPETKICDGKADCKDGSDEDCNNTACAPGHRIRDVVKADLPQTLVGINPSILSKTLHQKQVDFPVVFANPMTIKKISLTSTVPGTPYGVTVHVVTMERSANVSIKYDEPTSFPTYLNILNFISLLSDRKRCKYRRKKLCRFENRHRKGHKAHNSLQNKICH